MVDGSRKALDEKVKDVRSPLLTDSPALSGARLITIEGNLERMLKLQPTGFCQQTILESQSGTSNGAKMKETEREQFGGLDFYYLDQALLGRRRSVLDDAAAL